MQAFSQLSINIEKTHSCKGRPRFNCTKGGQKPCESTIQAVKTAIKNQGYRIIRKDLWWSKNKFWS